jgi:predicted secreted protein
MASLRRAGVTLVEVLVAAVVVSAVVIVIWYFYSHGMANLQATERILESTRGAHVLFELLHRDIKRAREVSIPKDLAALAETKMEPGDTLIYIDMKEYLFRKKARTVTIDGHPFRLGLFDEISYESKEPGVFTIRIVPVPSTSGKGEAPRLAQAGRYVLETTVTSEQIAAHAAEPTLVIEEAASHDFCLSGWPLDY